MEKRIINKLGVTGELFCMEGKTRHAKMLRIKLGSKDKHRLTYIVTGKGFAKGTDSADQAMRWVYELAGAEGGSLEQIIYYPEGLYEWDRITLPAIP
jgi:hypothetical protein